LAGQGIPNPVRHARTEVPAASMRTALFMRHIFQKSPIANDRHSSSFIIIYRHFQRRFFAPNNPQLI
jgi:hypothetical protein